MQKVTILDNIAVVTITTPLYRLVTIDKTFSEPNECKCNNELCVSSSLIKGKHDIYVGSPKTIGLLQNLKTGRERKSARSCVHRDRTSQAILLQYKQQTAQLYFK